MQAAWDKAFSMKDEKGSVTTMAVLPTTQINKAILEQGYWPVTPT
jgi:hypothetical protein